MPEFVYALCALASVLSAWLLVRSYVRTRSRLLMWSALCFVGLAVNNILLLVDLVFVPEIDLRLLRSASGIIALALLVIGLVWEEP
jgi:hypothetical protein